jgi:predicted signal transduction protein with EAL and GGDEF domain
VVTATPLEGGVAVANRLFPKTRSWFALDSPMELLSPLSVLRVLYGLAMLFWPVVGVAWRWEGLPGWVVLVGGAASVAVWVALQAVRTIGERGSRALVGLWVIDASLLVWAGHGTGTALAFTSVYGLMGVFVALFLPGRTVLAYQVVAGLALWVALLGALGSGVAAVVAALVSVTTAGATATLYVLTRSSRRQGTVDPDSGLPNGFGMARHLADRHPEARVVVAAVLVGGVDEAREALGYPVGTELLRRVVENVGQVVPARSLLARVEGDTLVVSRLLEGSGDRDEVAQQAFLLARALSGAVGSGRYLIGGVEVLLRASVGLALGPWDGTDVPELVRRATLSARRAANAGRLGLLWDGDHDTLTADDLALLAALGMAADRGELSLAYQPQVDPRTGRPASVEALLRWNSPVHGAVPPARFVMLAERTGLIDRLTGWILGEALDAQARWRAAGHRLPVSVNLSAKTLTRPDLAEWILDELGARQLSPSCLTVELTETAAADLPQAVLRLGQLRDRGVRISIDDFGTRHTSLAALAGLPVDELKIDRSFIVRWASSAADEAIVRTFCELAHRLGLVAVAEGVEDQGTKARLDAWGFDLVQGFHLSPPLAEADLLAFVAPSRESRPGYESAPHGQASGMGVDANPTTGEGSATLIPADASSPGTEPKNVASPPVVA